MGDEVDFLLVDKRKSFQHVDRILWVQVARHAQSNPNNKFAISLRYLQKNVGGEEMRKLSTS